MKFYTKKNIKPVLAGELAISKAIEKAYLVTEKMDQVLDDIKILKGEGGIESSARKAFDLSQDDGASITRFVNTMILQALKLGASDIHVEVYQNSMRVRFRVDGVLCEQIKCPQEFKSKLISRLKIMSELDIAEKRLPQDGRIKIKMAGKDIDIRLSTVPVQNGERIVMRILETPDKAPTFEELGFMGDHAKRVAEAIEKPNGMFLVTGPTGSGKSTTLFAALSVLNKEDVNITTLEDPVEYYVPGVNQSQVRPEVGFTFATGLRALLRQDPNIIMVGEIRDNETAELSIHAGLTGHFVLSTLHTNDALGAIPRMFDMHIEPFLLASTLNVVIAQRLVRKICEKCKEEEKLPDNIFAKVTKDLDKIPANAFYGGAKHGVYKFFHGKGCAQCNDTGYKGRIAIVETIDITKTMKDIIAKGFDRSLVEVELAKQNFITMDQDGLIKTLAGLTSIEEVLRVSKE